MVKELARQVEVPEGVDVQIRDSLVEVAGPLGNLSRNLRYPGISIKRDDSYIVVYSEIVRKRQKAMIGTIASHIANMVHGVTEGFEYRMKVVYSHFPIQLKATEKELIINNFLGERKPRIAKILGDTKVELQGDEVIITGIDKECVGQTMGNIEQATKVRGFDVRVFQDGIYLVAKG
jgi:large subunit ribosomal protein L6